MFLPKGKLNPHFTKYIFWSALENLTMGIETTLSTHSMLECVGLNSNVNNISLNYITKDILGQLGSLIIINKIGKLSDSNPKKFLIGSYILQEFCISLECLTPVFPIEYFIGIGTISNIGKCISYTCFGSFNAKIINTLSIDKDNIGEIYTKITIVNTLSISLGMSTGLLITNFIPCHITRLSFIPILSLLKGFFIYKSIENFKNI